MEFDLSRISWGGGYSDSNALHPNQDAFYVDDPKGLYMVADGVSGEPGADLASAIMTKVLSGYDFAGRDPSEQMKLVIKEAHRRIRTEASRKRELEGMATTVVIVKVSSGRAYVANAGDSSAFLVRGGSIEPLTIDDSGPGAMITQAVGYRVNEIHTSSFDIMAGDRLVLCSDGVTDNIPEAEIRQIVRGSGEPVEAAKRLVEASLVAYRKPDDITAVVCFIP